MKYTIITNGDKDELKRVLEILFTKGFVFSRERIRDVDLFLRRYELGSYCNGKPFYDWRFLAIGENESCKMVIEAWSIFPKDCIMITIEEFLLLNY